MGSSSSREPQPKVNRSKPTFLSFFCASSSSSTSQREDCAVESILNPIDYPHRLLQKSPNQLPSVNSSPVARFSTRSSPSFGPETSSVDVDAESDRIGLIESSSMTSANVHVVSTDSPQTSSLQVEEEPESVSSLLEESNEIVVSGRIPLVSDPGLGAWDDPIPEVMPPDETELDLLSISSGILPSVNDEITAREARRNNRRAFLDAFSSRSPRRNADFPAILLTTEESGVMGSRGRWLLDIGDDFFDDGVAVDSWHLSRRSREQRRNSRSEFWDRIRGVVSDSSRRTSCPFDLHTDGSCSCELDEEGSALSSISRIVLLAEALFEVLDEIHRQPESFSLTMLSVPAPESVVDSLPLRVYEKCDTFQCGDEVDQCHICLVEYEGGDKIRVLPCQHEYHMSCVDKWLKEIHGICPLCRGDVRGEGLREGTGSSTRGAGLT